MGLGAGATVRATFPGDESVTTGGVWFVCGSRDFRETNSNTLCVYSYGIIDSQTGIETSAVLQDLSRSASNGVTQLDRFEWAFESLEKSGYLVHRTNNALSRMQ